MMRSAARQLNYLTNQVARSLVDLGTKTIALIDSANPLGNPEKREGYMLALDQDGIELDPSLVSDPADIRLRKAFGQWTP